MLNFTKRAWAEINLDNLAFNYNTVKSRLGSTEILATVKADAYGHCEKHVTRKLDELGAPCFSVSNIDEAETLRRQGIQKPILILGYTPEDCAGRLVKNNIIQTVFSSEYAESLNQAVDAKIKVHIKIDTGMSRIGFSSTDIPSAISAIEKIYQMKNLEVCGIYTHLSHADSLSNDAQDFTGKQKSEFDYIVMRLKQQGYNVGNRHIQNSAAIHNFGGCGYEFARPGISLYGIPPSGEIKVELKPVMQLKAVISMVKQVPKGTPIGYSRTYYTSDTAKIATVSIGYGDGYSRLLSNKGRVIINGTYANIIGNVCMDQLMVDVTGIPAKQGDAVTLMGTDGDISITANEIGDLIGTIGYEITCMVNKRVPRLIFENGKVVDVVNCI